MAETQEDPARSTRVFVFCFFVFDHTDIGTLSALTGDGRCRKTLIPSWVPKSTLLGWEEVPVQPGNVFAGLLVVMDCHKLCSSDPASHYPIVCG